MKLKLLIVAVLLSVTSCAANNNKSGPGVLFTSTKDPVFFDNSVKPIKKGESCSTRALAFVAVGDASMNAAKNDGNITKVASADTEYLNILGIFGRACTVVKGE